MEWLWVLFALWVVWAVIVCAVTWPLPTIALAVVVLTLRFVLAP